MYMIESSLKNKRLIDLAKRLNEIREAAETLMDMSDGEDSEQSIDQIISVSHEFLLNMESDDWYERI